jgi:dTDP-4-dehydrorhamnose 3,5-epimerase
MLFVPSRLAGAFTVEIEKREDERGFFARAFCQREFAAAGLETQFVQANTSLTRRKGSIRGMHYQLPPSSEVKLVRCVRGAVMDVVVDIRPQSPTFKGWFSAELSAENRRMMYVPKGFAHGFQSLTEDAELSYMVSAWYDQPNERSLRYNDPAIGITWPLPVADVSAKDAGAPDWDAEFHGYEGFRSL